MLVLIAGAGPAGSRLSERLANSGIEVVIVERLCNARKDSFSSAVVPINSISSNSIPIQAVSKYWNEWKIYDPLGVSHSWINSSNLGAVLDFSKLREILWDAAVKSGVKALFGWSVLKSFQTEYYVDVELRDPNGKVKNLRVDYLVDATGHKRSLIGPQQFAKPIPSSRGHNLLTGSGVEWILQANRNTSNIWSNKITFFLGSKLITHGYGWIFPMANDQLKVGVCRVHPPNKLFKKGLSNMQSLKRLINEYELSEMKVLDKHGGSINTSIKRHENHFVGRIFGVGDTISTANLLGGEGIRYALASAEILSNIFDKLHAKSLSQSNIKSLNKYYSKKVSQHLGWRWLISNRIARKTWLGLSDEKADKRLLDLINGLSSKASAEGISALLFDYKFERYGLRLLPYVLGRQRN